VADLAPLLEHEEAVATVATTSPGPKRPPAPIPPPAGRPAFPSAIPAAGLSAQTPSRPRVRASRPRGRASRPAPGQLPLAFAPLPTLPVEADWKERPRLWGHAYHPMCSYLASFPAALAHAFIARYTRPGDVVLDPFSGRGTTALQACAEGRIGVGNDLNPLAFVLTGAKVDPPTGREIEARLARLRIDWSFEATAWLELAGRVIAGDAAHVPAAGSGAGARARLGAGAGSEPIPPEVALAFHPATLGQLLFVRGRLALDDRVDRFLAAALAGILHGKRPGYLSQVMPNTFSMAPRYVRDFVARTGFASPERDLFGLLGAKLRRLDRDGRPPAPGVALLGDARDAGPRAQEALRERALPDRARLVLTSPPYLRVLKYGYYNWLRTWFLGFSAVEIDATLDDAHRREPYQVFLREVLAGLRPALADDAVIAVVLGDVEVERGRAAADGLAIGLADEAWEGAARPEGYLLAGLVRDEIAAPRKVTRLWGEQAGQATKVDRILVLATSETGRRRALAGAAVPVSWDWPPRR
jgi:site-specific DNA-methyltransferase (adenine-specific)